MCSKPRERAHPLLNRAVRNEIEQVIPHIEKIETATEPRFQAHFVEAMAFPHKTDPYDNLQRVMKRPPRSANSAGREGARSGRNRRRARQPAS